MARAAVQFFTTPQAGQGQPNTPATATGILCPDWDKVKHKNTPTQPDQKPIYPSGSSWEWCWQEGQNKWCFPQLPILQSYSTRDCKERTTILNQPLSQDSEKCKEFFFLSLATSSVSETSCQEEKKRKAVTEHGWHTERRNNKKHSESCASMWAHPPHVFTLCTSLTQFSQVFPFHILADAFISFHFKHNYYTYA